MRKIPTQLAKSLIVIGLFVPLVLNAQQIAYPPSPETPPIQIPSQPRDTWAGAPAHVAGSALAGVACATHIYPKEPLKAFGCAMVPGVLKEIVDSQQKGNHFSQRDLISDAVGAALGVYTGGWMLTYSERDKTTKLSFFTQF